MRRLAFAIVFLLTTVSTAQGSFIETTTGLSYQTDGGMPGDAPDSCASSPLHLRGPQAVPAPEGELVPGDDVSDIWALAFGEDEGGPFTLTAYNEGPRGAWDAADLPAGIQRITVTLWSPDACGASGVAIEHVAVGESSTIEFLAEAGSIYWIEVTSFHGLISVSIPEELDPFVPEPRTCSPGCPTDYKFQLGSQ